VRVIFDPIYDVRHEGHVTLGVYDIVHVEPVFQPAPVVLPISNSSLNVTWISAEPSTQLRGVARNYSVYMRVVSSSASSWQVSVHYNRQLFQYNTNL